MTRHSLRPRKVQTGLALLSMMLVVSVLVLLATFLMRVTANSISNAQHQSENQQAYWYARAGETLAKQILVEDYRSSVSSAEALVQTDSLHDNWAQSFKTFKPDNAQLKVQIRDLNGCFNVNTLAGKNAQAAMAVFAQQLEQLSLPVALLSDVAQLVKITPLQDLSELRASDTLSADAYQRLSEVSCALPSLNSLININTASAAVLAAVLGDSNAEQIIKARKRAPLESVEAAGVSNNSPSSTTLGSESQYFEILSVAQYAEKQRVLRTRVSRGQEGEIMVLNRAEGPLYLDSHFSQAAL